MLKTNRKKCDGIICGHIHHAGIENIDGILYLNSGDWMESLTALVEDFDGNWKIINYADLIREEQERQAEERELAQLV